MEYTILKVKSNSIPNKVASTIVGMTKEGKSVLLQAIGNGAIGQSTKAIAIANKFIVKEEYKFYAEPVFVDLEIEGKEKTGVQLLLNKISDIN